MPRTGTALCSANHFELRSTLQKGRDDAKLIAREIAGLLEKAGFPAIEPRDHVERKERDTIALDNSNDLAPVITRHRRWRWDLEFISDRWWLVPLPNYRYLLAADPTALGMIEERIAGKIHVIRFDGNRGELERDGRDWVIRGRNRSRLQDAQWFVTFGLDDLKLLGLSGGAATANQFSFKRVQSAVKSSPFAAALKNLIPLVIPAGNAAIIRGERLQFGAGRSDVMKAVLKLGVKSAPERPVTLALCHAKSSVKQAQTLRNKWLALLLSPDAVKRYKQLSAARREIPSGAAQTIHHVWHQQMRLPAYEVGKGAVAEFDLAGVVADDDRMRLEKLASDRTVITMTLVPDDLPSTAFQEVASTFRNVGKAQMVTTSTIFAKGDQYTWANMAAHLAEKAGARLWDLDLPAAPEGAYFLGFDSGQEPHRAKQKGCFTLVDRFGHLVGELQVDLTSRSERVADTLLRDDVRNFMARRARGLKHLIVHRDGHYLPGEEAGFRKLGLGSPTTLVEIRKNSYSRIHPAIPGFWWRVADDRAFLITNDQAVKGGGLPVPIDVRAVDTAGISFEAIVEQVFWLTHCFDGNLFYPRRLPITIATSDSHARTGSGRAVMSYGAVK